MKRLAIAFITSLFGIAPAIGQGAEVFEIPFNEVLVVPCTGEVVLLQGTWQFTVIVHSDGNGGFHIVDNWNIHAEGDGSFGNEYRLNISDKFQVNIGADGLPFVISNPILHSLVSKGKAENVVFRAINHVTIDNTGKVTANFSNISLTCQ